MTIIADMKKDMIKLRLAKSELLPSMQFAISEIEKIGKKDLRETTDAESVSTIRKMIASLEENMKYKADERYKLQIEMLEVYLPTMTSDADVEKFIRDNFEGKAVANKGVIMKALKEKFGTTVDMKKASFIADSYMIAV